MYRRKPLPSTVFFLAVLCFSPLILVVQAGENSGAYEIFTDAATGEVYYIQDSGRFKKTEGPVVAVALGGGGARALVNVGILKALEEEAIPVDLVLGSSMGAIVAVLYGSGLKPEEIEALVTSDLLPSMFDLNYPFIRSIIDTRRVNFFLESVSPVKRLEDFPVPTALLSYDLANGVKYVHTAGPISREIQGSYAIPLFFPVAEYDGLYLIDPGILELTPAQTAKVLGADVVISTTAFDALPYDTYGLPVRAWTRFINLMKEDNSRRVIDECSDLTIHCQVGEYSFMDYHLAGEFIAIGYREAKKLMPQLKQVLAEKGIPLRPPSSATPEETADSSIKNGDVSDLNRVISDVKADRLIYDFTRIKPLLYFGKEHSFFKQRLLPGECATLQYGIFFQQKNTEIQVLTGGGKPRALEAQLRFIRLTPTFDLIGRLCQQEQAGDGSRQSYGADLVYYGQSFTASLGWLGAEGLDYLHTGGTFALARGRTNLKGEADLYIPSSAQQTETKYVYSQCLALGLGERFTLQPKLIISNTRKEEAFSHHLLYRGIEPEDALAKKPGQLVQASLELDYTYKFPYSLEIFQCLQVKEVTWRQFVDVYHQKSAEIDPAYAVGSGVACELNLLGIKPFSFGGYFAYDLAAETWRSSLSFDLVF